MSVYYPQVKLLGNLIKMTVGGATHAEAVSDDKTPTNPPPFSGHVDMSRIPVHDLAHSADEATMAKWKDIEGQMKLGKLKEVCMRRTRMLKKQMCGFSL